MEEYIHDVCEKEEILESVHIECENCINGFPSCGCREIIMTKTICKKCYEIENKINSLKDELDHLLFSLGYNVKNYLDCEEDIEKINTISKLLRHLNRMLCEIHL